MRGTLSGLTAALALATFTASAFAQTVPDPSTKPAMLHLRATGMVQVSQDMLVADLVANATSSTPAAAQRRVNTLVAGAMQDAKAVAGVDARAIGYSVGPADEKRTQWSAQQTVELRGTDGAALLDLAGKLQQRGLAAASLDWQLAPATRQKAYEAATTDALKQIQARAAAAAATLGLHLGRFADVRLDDGGNVGGPPRPMMAMARKMDVAPEATAAPEQVTADVSADVELRP